MVWPQTREFAGTARFQTVRRIGAGAMGVVYEALDRETGARLALKTLRGIDGPTLFRFKNEFRALQGIGHKNLVGLGDLIEEDGVWFFTMELVEGTDFLAYVRPGREVMRGSESPPTRDERSPRTNGSEATSARPSRPGEDGVLDEGRLRATLPQVVAGLLALHDAGKIHRDVKPSNVLVTPDGRVAIVDFGLIADFSERRRSEEGYIVGTATYMAPEQASATTIGPAADWYAVGVMLFAALTGSLPFSGTIPQVLLAKTTQRPRAPRELGLDVPADLEALCLELLDPDPGRRLSGRPMLARLGAGELAHPAPLPYEFVGRERERDALRRAYDDSRNAAVTVVVTGESGIGKSALVAEVAGEARARGAVVLTGRCFEREAVPYKGMDHVVDTLSEELATMTGEAELAGEHTWALLRMFPVLGRARTFAAAAGNAPKIRDPVELRDRAFAALRSLLSELAARRPLVLTIDDLHWANPDSLRLLAAVLMPPAAPRMLVLVTARSALAPGNLPGDVRELELGPLDPASAAALGQHLLGAVNLAENVEATALVRAAGGHPLHLDALVRHASASPGAATRLDLDEALRRRAHDLGDEATRVLELIAIADAPIARRVVGATAGLAPEALTRTITALGSVALVRGSSGGDRVEVYHDRVRTAVLGAVSDDDRQRAHAALAGALSNDPEGDPDEILRHLYAAGRLEVVAGHARAAAERAMSALAFDRAAELYQLAVRAGGGDRRALSVGLGDALAAAGRGFEAASAYTEAAHVADDAEALELRHRAAEQLLRSGHVDEGVAQTQRSLAALGIPFPSERWALSSLWWQRARLALRGLRFDPRDAAEVSTETLVRLDACRSAAMGLSMVSTVRSAELQSRHLRLALAAGERRRLARALSLEACLAASRSTRRVATLISAARRLAAEIDDPLADAWIEGAVGVGQFFDGRWRDALATFERAERLLRDRCIGVAWDITTVRVFVAAALFYAGDLAELDRLREEHLAEARRRGDLYAQVNLTTGYGNATWLARDLPDQGLAELREAIGRWSRSGFHVQHWYAMRAESMLALYTADLRGLESYRESMRALERSLLVHNRAVRAESQLLRARLAIAAAAAGDTAKLDEAERAVTRAVRERGAWVHALGDLARAGVARHRGDHQNALALLRRAATACEDAHMTLFAAAARWALGELVGGDEGDALAHDAEHAIAASGIRRPNAFVRVLLGWVPGPIGASAERTDRDAGATGRRSSRTVR